MTDVFIGIGSNIGERLKNIEQAIALLKNIENIFFEKHSQIIETDPLGGPAQNKFLNAVIKIKTSLEPQQLLQCLQGIENELSRVRTIKNGPRTIDLDILLYGEQIINAPDLKIPHPRMFEREFVMKPLLELAPEITDLIAKLKV